MSNRAFYYVDGIPTKGEWIELDEFTDTDDVKVELAKGGFIPKDADGDPDYDGDLLVADVEGALARAFYSSRSDTLDLSEFCEAAAYCDGDDDKEEAVGEFIDWYGNWDKGNFEDAYKGKYDSEKDYAEELFDEIYLHEVPEGVRPYIDYEKFARDLFISDMFFSNGHVFDRNV